MNLFVPIVKKISGEKIHLALAKYARSDCIEILYNLCYNTNICNEAKDILKSRNVIKLNYNITISSFRI